jgi:hypothetical protein
MKNQLLTESAKIIEALQGGDDELAAEVTSAALGDEAGGGEPTGELPPPPADELGAELPPEGMEGGAPEDEALGLLRDIASGITRLADELAPVEANPEAPEGSPEEEASETPEEEAAEHKDKEEPGVPPVEDEDEFNSTMPVATGA